MKTNILRTAVLLLFFVGYFASCEKENLKEDTIEDIVAYIIGYDVCSGVYVGDNGIGKAGGYVLVSENLKDTLAAYNLQDNIFTFPAEIMPKSVFGFNLFPEEYRFMYKVQITYRPMIEKEIQQTLRACITLYPQLYSFIPVYINIESISKIE